MVRRKTVALAIATLGLGIAGVALAGVETGSVQGSARSNELGVSLLEGKLTVASKDLLAGKVTLVVANKGKLTHALAIMGNGMSPKRTPTITAGKVARLTVTLKAGRYHIWDPVRSSMTHAMYLTVTAPKASGGGTGGSGGGSVAQPGGSGGSGGATTTMDDGMDGMEH
jgi:hypothetical protein